MNSGRGPRTVTVVPGEGCWRARFSAMASPCEILCKTKTAGEAKEMAFLAATEVWRIEDKYSRYLQGNVVAKINNAAGASIPLDSETAQLIDFAATLHVLSGKKFDITSGVLRNVWRFDGGSKLPSKQAVKKTLSSVGWQRVSWSSPDLRLLPGMEIDLGGIGKEYAVDRAAEIIRNACSASCLVNLGGDLAVSRRPLEDIAWHVGIEALDAATDVPAGLLRLEVGALATSGDARRFLMKNGVRYSHILDARSGWPVRDAPRSVTVAADTCTQAGMLCTMAMLEGTGAEGFLDAQDVKYWCDRGT